MFLCNLVQSLFSGCGCNNEAEENSPICDSPCISEEVVEPVMGSSISALEVPPFSPVEANQTNRGEYLSIRSEEQRNSGNRKDLGHYGTAHEAENPFEMNFNNIHASFLASVLSSRIQNSPASPQSLYNLVDSHRLSLHSNEYVSMCASFIMSTLKIYGQCVPQDSRVINQESTLMVSHLMELHEFLNEMKKYHWRHAPVLQSSCLNCEIDTKQILLKHVSLRNAYGNDKIFCFVCLNFVDKGLSHFSSDKHLKIKDQLQNQMYPFSCTSCPAKFLSMIDLHHHWPGCLETASNVGKEFEPSCCYLCLIPFKNVSQAASHALTSLEHGVRKDIAVELAARSKGDVPQVCIPNSSRKTQKSKAQISTPVSTDAACTSPSQYYCEPCSAYVPKANIVEHERGQKHQASRDKFVADFQKGNLSPGVLVIGQGQMKVEDSDQLDNKESQYSTHKSKSCPAIPEQTHLNNSMPEGLAAFSANLIESMTAKPEEEIRKCIVTLEQVIKKLEDLKLTKLHIKELERKADVDQDCSSTQILYCDDNHFDVLNTKNPLEQEEAPLSSSSAIDVRGASTLSNLPAFSDSIMKHGGSIEPLQEEKNESFDYSSTTLVATDVLKSSKVPDEIQKNLNEWWTDSSSDSDISSWSGSLESAAPVNAKKEDVKWVAKELVSLEKEFLVDTYGDLFHLKCVLCSVESSCNVMATHILSKKHLSAYWAGKQTIKKVQEKLKKLVFLQSHKVFADEFKAAIKRVQGVIAEMESEKKVPAPKANKSELGICGTDLNEKGPHVRYTWCNISQKYVMLNANLQEDPAKISSPLVSENCNQGPLSGQKPKVDGGKNNVPAEVRAQVVIAEMESGKKVPAPKANKSELAICGTDLNKKGPQAQVRYTWCNISQKYVMLNANLQEDPAKISSPLVSENCNRGPRSSQEPKVDGGKNNVEPAEVPSCRMINSSNQIFGSGMSEDKKVSSEELNKWVLQEVLHLEEEFLVAIDGKSRYKCSLCSVQCESHIMLTHLLGKLHLSAPWAMRHSASSMKEKYNKLILLQSHQIHLPFLQRACARMKSFIREAEAAEVKSASKSCNPKEDMKKSADVECISEQSLSQHSYHDMTLSDGSHREDIVVIGDTNETSLQEQFQQVFQDDEYNDDDYELECGTCGALILVLNNDVDFSLDVHIQTNPQHALATAVPVERDAQAVSVNAKSNDNVKSPSKPAVFIKKYPIDRKTVIEEVLKLEERYVSCKDGNLYFCSLCSEWKRNDSQMFHHLLISHLTQKWADSQSIEGLQRKLNKIKSLTNFHFGKTVLLSAACRINSFINVRSGVSKPQLSVPSSPIKTVVVTPSNKAQGSSGTLCPPGALSGGTSAKNPIACFFCQYCEKSFTSKKKKKKHFCQAPQAWFFCEICERYMHTKNKSSHLKGAAHRKLSAAK